MKKPKTKIEFSLCISVGQYGGFYIHKGYSKRICLGWISFTFFPCDIDNLLE